MQSFEHRPTSIRKHPKSGCLFTALGVAQNEKGIQGTILSYHTNKPVVYSTSCICIIKSLVRKKKLDKCHSMIILKKKDQVEH